MTASNTKPYLHPSEAANLLDIYDSKGRFDPVATAAAEKDIFSEANVVRVSGVIDHAATIVKHAAAKVVVANNRK